MKRSLGYVPALDGLRALAVALTIFYHAEVPIAWGGYLGVDMFFVLSGFLITTLLLEEIRDTGTISLKNFYVRRALRLYPALLMMLAVDALCLPLFPGTGWDFSKEAPVAGLYLTDYAIGLGFMPILTLVTHTWSLAVEEHFYILWPLALLGLRRRYPGRKLAPVLAQCWLAATGWKLACILSGQDWAAVYFRFDSHMSGLLLGAFLGAWLLEGGKLRWPSWCLPLSAVVTLSCIVAMQPRDVVAPLSIYVTIPAELFTFFLIAQVMTAPKHASVRWLAWTPLVLVGRISYGLYIFHYAAAYYMWPKHEWVQTLAVSAAVAAGLASLSWVTVEKAARRFRKRFGRE